MKTTNLDAIITSAPLNGTAARVLSQRGEHYYIELKPSPHKHWDIPPAMLSVAEMTRLNPQHGAMARATIGRRFGRLTVVGYPEEQNPKKKARWVVRCTCGSYEIRKMPSIKRGAAEAMCMKCEKVEYFKDRYRRLGSKGIDEFVAEKKA